MSKVEEMLATSGLSGILKKQEESDKTKRCIVTILALVGVVVAIAGIAYGVSYLSRQSRRNLKLLTTFANDSRYIGMRNFIKPSNRCYFGLKFAYETIPNQLVPFD